MRDDRRAVLTSAVNAALKELIEISTELEKRYIAMDRHITQDDFDHLLKCRMRQARAVEAYLQATEQLFVHIQPKAKSARLN